MLRRIANPIATLLITLLLLPNLTAAAPVPVSDDGSQVVSAQELQKAVARRAAERSDRIVALKKFFGSPEASRALRRAQLGPVRVQTAVASLEDADLARLASRAAAAERDFAAGALSNQEITYILIALATAVVVLIIVAA